MPTFSTCPRLHPRNCLTPSSLQVRSFQILVFTRQPFQMRVSHGCCFTDLWSLSGGGGGDDRALRAGEYFVGVRAVLFVWEQNVVFSQLIILVQRPPPPLRPTPTKYSPAL